MWTLNSSTRVPSKTVRPTRNHAGANLLNAHLWRRRAQAGQADSCQEPGESNAFQCHRFHIHYSEKSAGQEKWAIGLTVFVASGNVRFPVVGRVPMNGRASAGSPS